jgi:beta-lactamase superfamily II metal-dependent hydrolase
VTRGGAIILARMRRALLVLAVALAAVSPRIAAAQAVKPLEIHFIDVEGGQATLFVLPTGESMLVDTGFPALNGRDADRIAGAAKRAGLSRIDTLVVTHYHSDHVGGVPALASRIPIGTFVDHGPTVESGDAPAALYNAYLDARAKGRHVLARPGEAMRVGDLAIAFVSAGGDLIAKPLAGAGDANALCAGYTPKEVDATENARSVGMLLTYGRFRMLDLGDLTWNKEHDLACPNNLIGKVDVYLTTHHGLNQSGLPALVYAVHPRVAIMNNGARKGGSVDALRSLRAAPGLEDLWQLHYSLEGGAALNAPEPLLANVDETTAHEITIAAQRDGSFVVTNARNGHTKRYR